MKNKKIILFVLHKMTVGGAQRVVTNLANNFDRNEYEVHLCLFKKEGIFLENLNRDIKIHDLNSSRVLFGIHKLTNLFITLKPNIIFSSIGHVNTLISILIPFLRFFLKDTLFVARKVNNPTIRASYLKASKNNDFIYKKTINNFDYVICQSNFMKNDVEKYYKLKPKKAKVINNPLDINFIHEIIAKDELDIQFDKSKYNLIAVGALRKQKDFAKLLLVMELLDDNYHLYIVGDGEERYNLEAETKKLNIVNKVTFLGYKQNPYNYINKSDMVVVSSKYEGFPNIILEANACGKYVVSFECPGISNEIIQEGVNGSLVNCGNYELLADAIKKGTKGINPVKIIDTTDKYNIKNIIIDYNNLFKKAE